MAEEVKPNAKRRRGFTRISRKNQVTLPIAALRAAHAAPGDELRVEAESDGRIVLVRERDRLEELIGSMPGLEKATDLQRLRDEWEG